MLKLPHVIAIVIAWGIPPATTLAQSNEPVTEYEWTSRAEVKIGGKSLVASYAGIDPASNEEGIIEIARTITAQKIAENYPGGQVDRSTILVHARPLRDGGSKDVQVRVTLVCRTLLIVDEGLQIGFPGASIPVISDKKEKDRFRVDLTCSSADAGDKSFQGEIRTIGRGSIIENMLAFDVWNGRPIDGDQPILIAFGLRSKEKENGKFQDVGVFGVAIQETGGKLKVEFTPVSNAQIVGKPRFTQSGQITFRLTGKDEFGNDIQYDALVSVSDPHAAEHRAQKIRDFEQKLDDRPTSIVVLSGSATARYRSRQGQFMNLGVGRTFIVSKDTDAAKKFAAASFAGRRDVVIVADEAAAEAALKAAWKHSRNTLFKDDNVLDDTVKFSIKPKSGFTRGDDIATFPNGPR